MERRSAFRCVRVHSPVSCGIILRDRCQGEWTPCAPCSGVRGRGVDPPQRRPDRATERRRVEPRERNRWPNSCGNHLPIVVRSSETAQRTSRSHHGHGPVALPKAAGACGVPSAVRKGHPINASPAVPRSMGPARARLGQGAAREADPICNCPAFRAYTTAIDWRGIQHETAGRFRCLTRCLSGYFSSATGSIS